MSPAGINAVIQEDDNIRARMYLKASDPMGKDPRTRDFIDQDIVDPADLVTNINKTMPSPIMMKKMKQNLIGARYNPTQVDPR